MTSALAFDVVKFAGAAYLLFLGVRALLERPGAAWQFIQDLAGRLGKPLDMPDKGSQTGRANF